jgi:hypothetical protein
MGIVGFVGACAATPTRVVHAPLPAAAHVASAEPLPAPASSAVDPRGELLRLAVAEYRRAIELDPARFDAWFNLGVLLLDACQDEATWGLGWCYVRSVAELDRYESRYTLVAERARQRLERVGPCPPGQWGSWGVCHPLALQSAGPIPRPQVPTGAAPRFACNALFDDLPAPPSRY